MSATELPFKQAPAFCAIVAAVEESSAGCAIVCSEQGAREETPGAVSSRQEHSVAKLKLDLHDIYNRGAQIDTELNRIMQEAIQRRIELVEIIPGKGSGQLKKHVLRFLNQSHIRALYHRVEKDDRNFGRIFIHFRH
jgi:DNA-nicking Smr family endonuclease